MEFRQPVPTDAGRIQELVESSMTTSYRLSPQQITAITDDQFAEDSLSRKLDGSETVLRVVETGEDMEGDVIIGVVEGRVEGSEGEINWLFVDPEHWGKGIGSELFETMAETLRDRDAEGVRATVLEANSDGHQFVERFGFERTDERDVEIGDESLVKYVYAESGAAESDEDGAEEGDAEDSSADLPGTETHGGTTTATTEDGQRVFVNREEEESGTKDSFFVTYTDEDYDEQFGFYCSNCGSLQTLMDNMDRIECQNCGNSHASRGDEAYDETYL